MRAGALAKLASAKLGANTGPAAPPQELVLGKGNPRPPPSAPTILAPVLLMATGWKQ